MRLPWLRLPPRTATATATAAAAFATALALAVLLPGRGDEDGTPARAGADPGSGTPLADQLDGFRGHSYGLGPSLGYTRKFSTTSSLDLAFRYVVNLDARKQLEGDPLLFSVTYNP